MVPYHSNFQWVPFKYRRSPAGELEQVLSMRPFGRPSIQSIDFVASEAEHEPKFKTKASISLVSGPVFSLKFYYVKLRGFTLLEHLFIGLMIFDMVKTFYTRHVFAFHFLSSSNLIHYTLPFEKITIKVLLRF